MPQPSDDNNKPAFALSRGLAFSIAAGLGILLGGLLWVVMGPNGGGSGPNRQVTTGIADIGGPFALTTHEGVAVTDQDFAGSYKFIYFGYTFCPDVCPLGLLYMQDVLDRLGEKGAAVTPLFISIDPERDTPEVMKNYIASFHPRLIGLTGSPQAVAEVAAAYKMYYRKAPLSEDEEDPSNYGIDHMNVFFLMGPDGAYLAHFLSPTDPEDTAEEILSHLN